MPQRIFFAALGDRRRLAATLLLAFSGMAATAWLGYGAVQELVSHQQDEARARTTVLGLQNLLSLAVNAETGQRGYVITGMDRYLSPYTTAVNDMPAALDALRRSLHDDRHQLARLDAFERLQKLKFAELAESIAARREQGFAAAEAIVRSDRGRGYMVEMRSMVMEMTQAENDKLQARIAGSNTSAVRAGRIIIFAGLLNAALLLAVVAAVRAGQHARQRAAAGIERAQRLLRNVVDSSPAIIFVKDLAGRYLLVNAAFVRFYGVAADAALGKPSGELLTLAQSQREQESDRAVLERGEAVRFEEAALHAGDGTLHHFVSARVPLHDSEGRVQGLCGILSDVTPLKQAEAEVRELNQTLERRVAERTEELAEVNAELRDANTQLEAFSYTVAHDLRAPLRGIQGFADAVAEDYADRLDAVGRNYLMRIARAAARMEGLIEDLLAFARLSRIDLPPTHVAIADVVSETLRLLGGAITTAHARIDIDQPLHAVRANPAACVQILQNLLSNAIKFTRPDTVPHVRVRTEQRGARVRLWVEDEGIGIPPEQRERVFRPFERLHGQEEYAGTGIGLAIVDKAARRMGGACGVEDGPEYGSRFWVELPAADALEGETA